MKGTFHFYPKHKPSYGFIILNAHNDKFDVNFEDSCHALNGDEVIYDQKIHSVTKRCNIAIPGILCLSSRVMYGITKKKLSLKLFKPLDKTYPNFLVATSKPMQAFDVYCTIKFKEWTSTLPIGTIENLIGNVGDIDAEKKMLLIKHNIVWNKIQNYTLSKKNFNRIDLTSHNTFSVDPEQCQDIDDAVSIEFHDNNRTILHVHIADVTSYIDNNSEFDQQIRKRGTSIYLSYAQINMLPDELSTNEISLKTGLDKRAVTTTFDIQNGEIVSIHFFRSLINNKANLTYEQIDKLINGNSDHNIPNMLENDVMQIYSLMKKMYKSEDSHQMIEQLMIMTNSAVAEELAKRNNSTVLLRAHTGIPELIKNDVPENIIKRASIRMSESAKYVVGVSENSMHLTIGKKLYTHFTSPIRRYADIIVHRLLLENDQSELKETVEQLNQIQKRVKKAERESYILDILYSLKKYNDSVIDTYGYVLMIDDVKLTLYLPEFNFDAVCKILSKEAKTVISYKSTCDRLVIKEQNIDIKLFDKISVRVIVSFKSTNKLLIQLIH